jgi:hypothetical protein
MTLHATRDGKNVKVHITYGPVTAAVEEEAGHVAHFHAQLGNLLGDDKLNFKPVPEERARQGYERYRQHAGGVSKFTGDPLPAFDDQDDDIKGHWIAAFTE